MRMIERLEGGCIITVDHNGSSLAPDRCSGNISAVRDSGRPLTTVLDEAEGGLPVHQRGCQGQGEQDQERSSHQVQDAPK
jgi:hypothetical protein